MTRFCIAAAAAFVLTFAAAAAATAPAAAPGPDGLVPNSLADAAVGEWALYKAENGYQQRFSVIERDAPGAAATVTVQIDTIYDGEVTSSAFYSDTAGEARTPPAAPGGGKVAGVRQEAFAVAGKSIAATVVRVVPEDGEGDAAAGGTEWWVAGDVPVFGLVKQVEDGGTVLELLEFGKE